MESDIPTYMPLQQKPPTTPSVSWDRREVYALIDACVLWKSTYKRIYFPNRLSPQELDELQQMIVWPLGFDGVDKTTKEIAKKIKLMRNAWRSGANLALELRNAIAATGLFLPLKKRKRADSDNDDNSDDDDTSTTVAAPSRPKSGRGSWLFWNHQEILAVINACVAWKTTTNERYFSPKKVSSWDLFNECIVWPLGMGLDKSADEVARKVTSLWNTWRRGYCAQNIKEVINAANVFQPPPKQTGALPSVDDLIEAMNLANTAYETQLAHIRALEWIITHPSETNLPNDDFAMLKNVLIVQQSLLPGFAKTHQDAMNAVQQRLKEDEQ